MGYNLANRDDQVITWVKQAFIDLNIDWIVDQAFAHLTDILSRNRADLDDVVLPAMRDEHRIRHIRTEKLEALGFTHRIMGAQGRHDVDLAGVLEHLVVHCRDFTGIGMQAGHVRRQKQDFLQILAFDCLGQSFQQLFIGDALASGTDRYIDHGGHLSLFVLIIC